MFKKNKQTLHCQDLFIIPIKWFFRTKIQLILHHKNEYLAIKLLHFRCIFILCNRGSVLKQQNSRQNITTDSAINSDQGHWIKMYLMEKPAWCCILHCTKMHSFLNLCSRDKFSPIVSNCQKNLFPELETIHKKGRHFFWIHQPSPY